MKTGIYGGTFNPIHNGHLHIVEEFRRGLGLDRVLLIPTRVPPHKAASATPGQVRLAMCRCFTALSPVVEVSDWEIRQGGRSYTVHTLEMLRDRFPGAELYLGVGSDMLLSFTRWRRWQEILSMATLVVESRRPGDGTALHTGAEALQAAGGRVLFAHAQSYPCASSDLRTGRIPRADWGQYLPATVLQVIQSQDLYRTADVPPVEKEEPNHDL